VSEKLVTIRNFAYSPDPVSEAHLARLRLESENIPCFLSGEHSVGTYWFSSVVGLGVRLQVRQSDVDRARAALETGANPALTEVDGAEPANATGPDCPKCGSREVYYQRYSRAFFYFALLLFRFPLPYPKQRYRCDDCGHTWQRTAPGDETVELDAKKGAADASQ
jgi:hypothetical protein